MIIGINGKIGSGKDTVGKIIQYLIATNNLPKDMQYESIDDLDHNVDLILRVSDDPNKLYNVDNMNKVITYLLSGLVINKITKLGLKEVFSKS